VADHDVSDDSEAVAEDPSPLQRVLDLLVFAPVGVALTVVDDLPGLIGKGRQRFETDVQNARVIGQFVVNHGQREVVQRVGKLLHRDGAPDTDTDGAGDVAADGFDGPGATVTPLSADVDTRPSPSPKPDADPADVAIVEAALAGYDTLSASQVVRRLESLGPDELSAIHRHEASHRNRRTILNRAQQLLEGAGPDRPAG
jgi:hypothetical protein